MIPTRPGGRPASCNYGNTLADIDRDGMTALIRAGLLDLATLWPVGAT